MAGSWFYLPEKAEWRLYDLGRLQIRVAASKVDELAVEHGVSRLEVLTWIGSRPAAPFAKQSA